MYFTKETKRVCPWVYYLTGPSCFIIDTAMFSSAAYQVEVRAVA